MTSWLLVVQASRKCLAATLAAVLAFQPLTAQELDTAARTQVAARNAIAMQRSLQALEDGLADIPRDRWDPQDVVDTIGIDAPLLYGFLRSRTRWVPYQGALRGPLGVLMDQRGNSLDQSLLLARLYELAGFEVRLAHGSLDTATMDRLLAGWRNPLPEEYGAAAQPGPLPAENPDELAVSYDLAPEAVIASLQVNAERASTTGTRLREMTAIQVSALVSAFGTLPPDRETDPDEQKIRQSLADHWWVEVNDGGWQAADPLEPGAEFGKALTGATETLSLDELPEDLWHHVTVRLVIEQAKGGKALTGTVLEQRVRAADMVGQEIRLDHYPTQWPATWPTTTPDDLQTKLRAALATQKEWLPTLTIGGQEFNQGSIKDNGDINLTPSPVNPFAVIGVPIAGDISKVVDALSLPGEAGQVAPGGEVAVGSAGELTAEWLDFSIERPGLPPEEIRRTLFDIAGPAFRTKGDYSTLKLDEKDRFDRSMAMLGQVQAILLPAAPPAGQILARQAEQILANKPILDEIAKDPFGEIPGNIVELLGKMRPVPVVLDGFASARFSQSPVGDAVYLEKPMIVALHNELVRDRNTGDFNTQAALDIISSGVAVDPFSGIEPFKARLVQGVHDTLTEALALGGGSPGVLNAALALDQQPAGWMLLRDRADPLLASLDPDFAERLETDLSAGAFVLVPPGPEKGKEVWWKIDPYTGETLGYGSRGWGQALVEYAFVLVIKTLLSQIACMASSAAIDAGMNAFETGNPNLPKNWKEVKEGAKKYAKSCVSRAMLAQLTGISTTFLLNGASSLGSAIEGGLRSRYGTDPYWEARNGGGRGFGGPPPPPGGPPPGGPPPGSGNGPQGGTPGSGPASAAEAQAAHDRAVEAQQRAYDAKARMDANPTPQNRQEYEKAIRDYDAAMQDRMNAWARSGSDRDPPKMPTPYGGVSPKAQTGMNPAANGNGGNAGSSAPVDPNAKTGVQTTGPDGRPNPALEPTGQMPATGPDIPRGLPQKPPGYQYGQKDVDEARAMAQEAARRAAEAGSRAQANPTPENQADYERALKNLGNAEQNVVEAHFKAGGKFTPNGSSVQTPGPAPGPAPVPGGVDPFGQTGVQTTQADGSSSPALQPTVALPAIGGTGGGGQVDPLGQTGVQTTQPDGSPNPALKPTVPLPAVGGGNAASMVDPLGATGLQQQLPDGRPNPALQPTVPLPATGGGFGGAGAGAGDVLSPAANSVPPTGLPQPAPSNGKTSPGLGLGATQGYNSLLLGLSGLGSAVKP